MKILLLFFYSCCCVVVTAQIKVAFVPKTLVVTTNEWLLKQRQNFIAQNHLNIISVKSRVNSATEINGTARIATNCNIANYGCASGGALPVTGLELTGIRVNENKVKLDWKVYTEINNNGYQIERSVDNLVFNKVSFVSGNINSTREVTYELFDGNSYESTTYYRIKQTDIGGAFRYSNIIAVKGISKKLGVVAIPNPAKNTNIIFQLNGMSNATSVYVLIMNSNGKIIYKNEQENLSSSQVLKLNLNNLPAGAYYIKIIKQNETAGTSFIIIQ